MQAEIPVLERFTHVYTTYRVTRLLCLLALPGAAWLLFFLSGGFPPWAWRLLAQTLPHFAVLLAQHGSAAFLALCGLVALAVTILLAWWALLWLAWHMLTYEISEHRELHRFATDMREAHDLAQAEKLYATSYTSSPQRLAKGAYVYPEEQQAYRYEPREQWVNAEIVDQALPLVKANPTRSNVGLAGVRSSTPHLASHAKQTLTVPLSHTDLRIQTDDLPQIASHAHTDTLQDTNSDMLSSLADVDTQPDPLQAFASLPSTITAPWPPVKTQPTGSRSVIQLVVGTGLNAGFKRKGQPNEDSLFALQHTRFLRGSRCPVGLFVIADGMGGHKNGQEASRLVIQSLSTALAPVLTDGPADDNYAELLAESVHRANLALYQRNRQKRTDMGTTLTAALIINTTAYIVNVGDSRVYLYRAASGLSQVTRDHSTVALLVEKGALKPEEVYTHPRRNEIYRSLGHQASQDVDSFILAVQPDDLLMLCSDGLWEMVRDPHIQDILSSEGQQPAQLSSALVQAALDGGGKDNISVIVVGVKTEEATQSVWAS